MALLPPSSSSSSSFTYDVFLSFRGPDTRHNFIGFLYKALCDKGIHTFIDDEELPRGDEITPALVKAIKESSVAIPVFSENYASSSFCLDELVNIIDHVKGVGRLILPVFYKVDPSHMRHQTGSYGEALAKHEERLTNNMERLQKWKMALQKAANLSGIHFKLEDGYEYKLIDRIVEEVSNNIRRNPLLHVADHPVGLESRMHKIMSLLDVKSSDEVLMVGIYGLGGIGKTTLARAVYNSIANSFEGSCFLHNVRENSTKQRGLEHLQEELLSKTIGLNVKLGDVSEGIPKIKQKLQKKKVLLILDDIDNEKQLKAMVGEPNWFGPGSRVIVTTRDKHLLANHGVERTYEIHKLSEEEALELFKWNAFKQTDKVDPSYENILKEAVVYASGLPLALEVIGSLLFGKSIQEWRSAIDRFKEIPSKEILDKLKISYDGLEENQQKIFLDISCCLKGYRLREIEEILSAHYGVCVKYDIGVLADKSLIKISYFVTMHDLIEEMGKEIVRQESPKEHGKRSRLWFHEDIIQVLEENTGTSEIEMIHLNSWLREEVKWDGEAFKKMKNLKTLIIRHTKFCKGPEYLPNSLRVLEWMVYPSPDLPPDFHPKNLSTCNLFGERLTSFEMHGSLKPSKFMNMRVLELDSCGGLTRIVDVSCFPNLEKLSFRYCGNLATIHNSVGFLHKLKLLDARGCYKIKEFPPLQLPSLQELHLSECSRLESFPAINVEMKYMTELDLFGTPIKEFPSAFRNLSGLQRLKLENEESVQQFVKSSILLMPQLAEIHVRTLQETIKKDSKVLSFRNWEFSDELLAFSLSWCANVKKLDLSKTNLTVVPEFIKECRFLQKIHLDGCKQLEEIRGIPPNLEYLSARECESLSPECRSMLLNQEVHEAGNTRFILPSPPTTGIPEWFEHQSMGGEISFWYCNNFPHIALCVVCPSRWEWGKLRKSVTMIINKKKFQYIEYCIALKDNINNSTDEDDMDCIDEDNMDCIDNSKDDDKIDCTDDGHYYTHLFHIRAENVWEWGEKGKQKVMRSVNSPFPKPLAGRKRKYKNEWNCVKVIINHHMPIKFGIHVLSGHIQFTNPAFTLRQQICSNERPSKYLNPEKSKSPLSNWWHNKLFLERSRSSVKEEN